MENSDNCGPRTFSQEFYFYPRIYSDKCHYDLAWYKKIFYFIRLIPIMYFYALKPVCSAIFLGKVYMDVEYVGDFFATDEEKISVVYRIMTFIGFVFYHVIPLLALCLFVTSLFVSLPLILSSVMWMGVCIGAFAFLSTLVSCGIFLAFCKDFGIKGKLYACNCDRLKGIHWSTYQCELTDLEQADDKKLLYPGKITEVKLDDIHL